MFSNKHLLISCLCMVVLSSAVAAPGFLEGVSAQSPTAFSKIAPIHGTIIPLPASTNYVLQWSDANIASTDRYQYCIDETDNSICDTNDWITRNSLYSGGPGEFTLQVGHTYYWQVRLRDAGIMADNGVWGKFTVQSAVTFTKTNPPNGAIIAQPATTYQLLEWAGTTKESNDRYQYCIDETNNSICDNNSWITRDSLYSGGPGEFDTQPGHIYYWQVRLRDAETQANDGVWWTFTVQPPTSLIKTSPANGAIIPLPATTFNLLQWSNVKSITDRYQYCIDETDNAQCDGNRWVLRDTPYSGGPGDFTLIEGRTYYWQVRLRDSQSPADGGTWRSFTIRPQKPSVIRITRTSPNPVSAANAGFAVTFSEAVTGVDATDFMLSTNISGAAIEYVTGSDNLYIVSIRLGSGSGNLRLDLADDDSIVNTFGVQLGGTGAGNGNYNAGETYEVDRVVPAISSITRADSNPTNATTVRFNVVFSESVTGVDLSDFSLVNSTGAALTNISGSGANYTVTVMTGSNSDSLQLNFIDNKSVVDAAGNSTNSNFVSGETYIIDRTPPTAISIIQASQPDPVRINFTIRFSEPVTGVDAGDFILSTINGAEIASISGSGASYLISVLLKPGSDTIRIDITDNDSITDSVGNLLGGTGIGNGNLTGGNVNVMINVPKITSIIRASSNPTNAQTVDFIVTFSEPVNGVDTGDFQISGGTVAAINNQNPFYIVSVNTEVLEGQLKLDVVDNDSIQNYQGMSLGGSGTGNGNYLNGEVFDIDRKPPRITSIIRAGGNPAIGSTADFIVTFSESVTGVEAGDFTVSQSNVIKSAVISLRNVDPFYWVTVQTGAGTGTIRLDLMDNGNISDRAGNKLENISFINGEIFNLAKTTVNFPAPVLAAPAVLVKENQVLSFSWTPVPNAQAYEYFIAHDSASLQIIAVQTVPETTTQIQTQIPDGMYYVRVRAYDQDLNPGKFSNTISILVDVTPPAPPRPISPTDRAEAPKRPWLRWSIVGDAAQYQLEVDNDRDFSSPVYSTATRSTSIQTGSLYRRTYYWRVRAVDAAGNWSEWSNVFSFTVP